jgi:hypothetical protein
MSNNMQDGQGGPKGGAPQLALVEEDPSQPSCAISGEPFERTYDPDVDKWYYEDAVVLSGEEAASYGVMDGSIVKVHCLAGGAGDGGLPGSKAQQLAVDATAATTTVGASNTHQHGANAAPKPQQAAAAPGSQHVAASPQGAAVGSVPSVPEVAPPASSPTAGGSKRKRSSDEIGNGVDAQDVRMEAQAVDSSGAVVVHDAACDIDVMHAPSMLLHSPPSPAAQQPAAIVSQPMLKKIRVGE